MPNTEVELRVAAPLPRAVAQQRPEHRHAGRAGAARAQARLRASKRPLGAPRHASASERPRL